MAFKLVMTAAKTWHRLRGGTSLSRSSRASHSDTCRRLINKADLAGRTFVTDNWDGCHRVIPPEQLVTSKDLTFPIKQGNSNVRHCLARFGAGSRWCPSAASWWTCPLRPLHHLRWWQAMQEEAA